MTGRHLIELVHLKTRGSNAIIKVVLNAKISEAYRRIGGIQRVITHTWTGGIANELDYNIVKINRVQLNEEEVSRISGDTPMTDVSE